mmetsp:Transcript_34520/g.73528  ORF Transcript_34520/g.73528 Transcript_34520/m.73528 type:complete len:236 (-) Transcript_34520:1081-1788(-)
MKISAPSAGTRSICRARPRHPSIAIRCQDTTTSAGRPVGSPPLSRAPRPTPPRWSWRPLCPEIFSPCSTPPHSARSLAGSAPAGSSIRTRCTFSGEAWPPPLRPSSCSPPPTRAARRPSRRRPPPSSRTRPCSPRPGRGRGAARSPPAPCASAGRPPRRGRDRGGGDVQPPHSPCAARRAWSPWLPRRRRQRRPCGGTGPWENCRERGRGQSRSIRTRGAPSRPPCSCRSRTTAC